MSYEGGSFEYFTNSIIFNFVPMYIFGAGVLAILNIYGSEADFGRALSSETSYRCFHTPQAGKG